jgi:protein phosphatase
MMEIQLNAAYSFCQRGRRDYQEDSRYPDVDNTTGSQRFFIVCDGVGGCEKGEVASQTVCQAMGKAMKGVNLGIDFTNNHFHNVLDAAYHALDKIADDSNRDMGTTMTFVCFHAGGCTMAHIGDSRIYQIRPSEGIIYRSDDHSLVNSLVHNGMLTPDEANSHPQRNVITRYMEAVEADQNRCTATVMRTEDVKAGDYFLLCTDGVLHCISDDELQLLLLSDKSDEEKMKELAGICLDSEDNNTAWLISIQSVTPTEEADSDNDATESEATKRLTMKTRQQEEIESVQAKNTQLKKWFNKIFN